MILMSVAVGTTCRRNGPDPPTPNNSISRCFVMLMLLRKTQGLDGLAMSLELLRRQTAPFGAVADIPGGL